ncbi:MAG: hypothetical protein AABX11_04375 [Nanoarchaeota archaeon]
MFETKEVNHSPTISIVTILFVAIFIISLFAFNLKNAMLVLVLFLELAFYVSIVILLSERNKLKLIENPNIRVEERAVVQEVPVIKEVEVEKPVYVDRIVDRMVDRVVEKPVYLEKHIYHEKKRAKLNIPKYDYLGSSETKVYHLRSCRISRSIKRKYKISNNSKNYFVNNKYRACKLCLKKKH